MRHNIKLGLTLYSFSSEYINKKMSIEDILKTAKEMGYKGIEIIPAQMAPTYPYLTQEWINELKRLLKKYDLEPVCWSAYLDLGVITGKDLSEDEIIQYTLNDLIYAKKSGFSLVRTQYSITPKLLKAMIPYCKDLDMKLAIEMHHPHHPETELWKEYIEIMRGEGKGYVGLVPDFGIFIRHPHKLWLDQALEMGFRPEKLSEVTKLHAQGVSYEAVIKGLYENEAQITKDMYEAFNHPAVPSQIKDLVDISFYMHGKFYYAEEGKDDNSIPYEEILKTVAAAGYQGYIACEYEGHHFTDEIPAQVQLERYIAMCRRILGTK